MRKRILSVIRKRATLVGLAAVAAILAVPVVTASASIPNSVTGAITGCVKNQGSAVRIIDAQAGATCAADERTLNWPGVGGAATQYFRGSDVNLSHDAVFAARSSPAPARASRERSPASPVPKASAA